LGKYLRGEFSHSLNMIMKGFSSCLYQWEKSPKGIDIGLNNIHRLTESNRDTYAAVGSWTSPNTFSIDYEIIGYTTKDKWNFTFDGEKILIEEVGVTGKYRYSGKRMNKRIIKE
jgi:hypothetical protein